MVPPTNKFILTSKELDSEHYLWFINDRGGRCQSFPYVNVTIALPCEWNFCKENGEVEIGNLWLERKKIMFKLPVRLLIYCLHFLLLIDIVWCDFITKIAFSSSLFAKNKTILPTVVGCTDTTFIIFVLYGHDSFFL